MNELDDEIHKHIPHYPDLVELLRATGVWQFTLEDLEKQYASKPPAQGVSGPKDALEQLYDFSLIGFYRPGGRGYGGSEYVFKYKEPRTRFDPTATRFRIHPGLIDILGLKRFTMADSQTGTPTD
jgi:hypothetical protein